MRHFINRLFCWNESAKGAFFALSFWFVGSALLATLCHMLWLFCCSKPVNMGAYSSLGLQIPVSTLVAIFLFSIAILVRAIVLLVKNCRHKKKYKPLFGLLGSVICAGAGLSIIAIVLSTFFHIGDTFFNFTDNINSGELSLCKHIAPGAWWMVYLLGVLLLLTGGFLCVKACAAGEGKRIREAVCKRTLALWGCFWIAYLTCVMMALCAGACSDEARELVGNRFGHEVSADGLRESYQQSGSVDGEFWKRLKENSDNLSSRFSVGERVDNYWDGLLPDNLTPETLDAFEAYCQQNENAILEMEKGFDTVPPLPDYNFVKGNLYSIFPALSPSRQFARLERTRLRVFLAKGNMQDAWRAYQRLVNCTEHVKREPFIIGRLVWIVIQDIRLDAMEALLESRKLSNDDILRFETETAALEQQIPLVSKEAMFSEAVFGQDTLSSLQAGSVDCPIAIAPFRWFWPQVWFHLERENCYILNQYLREDFSCFDKMPPKPFFLARRMMPALQITGAKFDSLTARVRAMRALLNAERHFRQHGDYPAELAGLPEDPFTGKPLLYKYGVVDIPVSEWSKETNELLPLDITLKPIKSVQVWSVGKDGVDNGGVSLLSIKKDDICARIRLE